MEKEFLKRLKNELVYLWEDESGLFIKSVPAPGAKFLAKFPNGEEFELAPDSDVVVRALAADVEISAQKYKNEVIPAADKAVSQ